MPATQLLKPYFVRITAAAQKDRVVGIQSGPEVYCTFASPHIIGDQVLPIYRILDRFVVIFKAAEVYTRCP